MWFLNGCNPIKQSHVFCWTSSTTRKHPWRDVECGCGVFILKANTGETVPSQKLLEEMEYAKSLLGINDDKALGGE